MKTYKAQECVKKPLTMATITTIRTWQQFCNANDTKGLFSKSFCLNKENLFANDI